MEIKTYDGDLHDSRFQPKKVGKFALNGYRLRKMNVQGFVCYFFVSLFHFEMMVMLWANDFIPVRSVNLR